MKPINHLYQISLVSNKGNKVDWQVIKSENESLEINIGEGESRDVFDALGDAYVAIRQDITEI